MTQQQDQTGFSGPIGKALPFCLEHPPVQFEPINLIHPLPTIDLKNLSSDQRYLLEMCDAVDKGQCPIDLATRNPGILNHSRWITTANRILRLYIGVDNPSKSLKQLVTFIIRVYAPTWFAIKFQPSCKDGAKHFYEIIKKTRYLKEDFRAIVDTVIQRNGYYAHHENIILSMITDDRETIRELGLRRILKA